MQTTDYSNHMEYITISVSRQQSLDAIYIYLIFIISSVQNRCIYSLACGILNPFRMYLNRPLPSSKNPHLQIEAKCTTFQVEMSFICVRMKTHFHIKDWALNLVLIQRPRGNSEKA